MPLVALIVPLNPPSSLSPHPISYLPLLSTRSCRQTPIYLPPPLLLPSNTHHNRSHGMLPATVPHQKWDGKLKGDITHTYFAGWINNHLQHGNCKLLPVSRASSELELMRDLQLQKYLNLPQKGQVIAEYVWIDGSNGLRSKSKVSAFLFCSLKQSISNNAAFTRLVG
jgi:hypothetical protein